MLKQVVREYLTGHPLVKSFDFAAAREGGDGVTIAALANLGGSMPQTLSTFGS